VDVLLQVVHVQASAAVDVCFGKCYQWRMRRRVPQVMHMKARAAGGHYGLVVRVWQLSVADV